MPSLQDYFGINPESGLGIASQGIRGAELAKQQDDLNMANLFLKQQQGQGAGIENQLNALKYNEAQQTSPSRVQTQLSDNDTKQSANSLQQQQDFYQQLSDAAPSLERLNPQQRQQVVQMYGQKYPQLANSPVYQDLLNTDPSLLPNKVKQIATNGLLNTGDQLRKKQLQDAQFANQRNIVGMQEGGANARNAATLQNSRDLEQMRIDAGKYNKAKAMTTLTAALRGAKTYQQASLLYAQSADEAAANGDMDTANALNAKAQDMTQRDLDQKRAMYKPGTILDENGGFQQQQPVPPQATPYGGTQPTPPAAAGGGSVPSDLPKGTVNNGDGTFTLPSGMKIRPKKQ